MMQTGISYAAGQLLAVVAPRTVLVVDAPTDWSLAGPLWELALDDAPVEEILDVVIRRGIRTAPSFAIVRVEGDAVRALVRGAVPVCFERVGEPVRLDATGATTWLEGLISGARRVLVGPVDADSPLPFLVSTGVVLVSGLALPCGVALEQQQPEPVRVGSSEPVDEAVDEPIEEPASPVYSGPVGEREFAGVTAAASASAPASASAEPVSAPSVVSAVVDAAVVDAAAVDAVADADDRVVDLTLAADRMPAQAFAGAAAEAVAAKVASPAAFPAEADPFAPPDPAGLNGHVPEPIELPQLPDPGPSLLVDGEPSLQAEPVADTDPVADAEPVGAAELVGAAEPDVGAEGATLEAEVAAPDPVAEPLAAEPFGSDDAEPVADVHAEAEPVVDTEVAPAVDTAGAPVETEVAPAVDIDVSSDHEAGPEPESSPDPGAAAPESSADSVAEPEFGSWAEAPPSAAEALSVEEASPVEEATPVEEAAPVEAVEEVSEPTGQPWLHVEPESNASTEPPPSTEPPASTEFSASMESPSAESPAAESASSDRWAPDDRWASEEPASLPARPVDSFDDLLIEPAEGEGPRGPSPVDLPKFGQDSFSVPLPPVLPGAGAVPAFAPPATFAAPAASAGSAPHPDDTSTSAADDGAAPERAPEFAAPSGWPPVLGPSPEATPPAEADRESLGAGAAASAGPASEPSPFSDSPLDRLQVPARDPLFIRPTPVVPQLLPPPPFDAPERDLGALPYRVRSQPPRPDPRREANGTPDSAQATPDADPAAPGGPSPAGGLLLPAFFRGARAARRSGSMSEPSAPAAREGSDQAPSWRGNASSAPPAWSPPARRGFAERPGSPPSMPGVLRPPTPGSGSSFGRGGLGQGGLGQGGRGDHGAGSSPGSRENRFEPPADPPREPPRLLGVWCDAGHVTSPDHNECRACGLPVPPQAPILVARPPLGVLIFDNGDRVEVDRPVILGRDPKPVSSPDPETPVLHPVASATGQVSRTHAEVRAEGWDVVLTDLDAMNGTALTLPGAAPVAIEPGVPTVIRPGSRVDLGGETGFVFEIEG